MRCSTALRRASERLRGSLAERLFNIDLMIEICSVLRDSPVSLRDLMSELSEYGLIAWLVSG